MQGISPRIHKYANLQSSEDFNRSSQAIFIGGALQNKTGNSHRFSHKGLGPN